MLRTGVLLPRSTLFPAFGLDIFSGIKTCLKHFELADHFTFLTDNIGFGIEEAEIYSKAEKLLLQDDADVVIVVADLSVGELLEPLFSTSNKILLLVNMGAGIPEIWKPAPTTIVHSLNLSLHARLTAKLAAVENVNKKGMYILSYYDAGYRQTYSMMNSHQQNGGEPVFTHVTHLKAEQFTLQPALDFLEQNEEVGVWLSLFTGEMAHQFCEAVIPVQQKWNLKIYGSPMLMEACIERSKQQQSFPGFKGYIPWWFEDDTAANREYKNAFKKSAGKEATLFGVLGWDAGLLLKEIARLIQQEGKGNAEILPILSAMNLESPRGWMKIDPKYYHSYGPSRLVSLGGVDQPCKAEDLFDTTNEWESFSSEKFPPDSNSGWRNTYLCI